MRVLHVIPSVSRSRGGPSFAITSMARGLTATGLRVDIATTDDDGAGRRTDVPLGEPLVRGGAAYWYFPRQSRFYTVSVPLTLWLARNASKYDLIHIHGLFSYPTLPAALFAYARRVPYVVRPLGTLNRWGMQNRHPWIKGLSFRLLEGNILGRAAVVHYTSEQERLEAQVLGFEQQRAVVVPLGIDVGWFDSLPPRGWLENRAPHLASRKMIFLFLSRLAPIKGLDLLLPAFAHLRERASKGAALVIVGSGERDFVTRMRQLCSSLGIEQDVFWAGFLSGRDKLSAFAEADAFVLPSYSENFGVAAVEAMASRLPVIVSDQVGIHREIAEGEAGLVTDCSVRSLTNAMRIVAHSADLRQRLGANAQRLANDTFSIEAMTDRLLRLYEMVL